MVGTIAITDLSKTKPLEIRASKHLVFQCVWYSNVWYSNPLCKSLMNSVLFLCFQYKKTKTQNPFQWTWTRRAKAQRKMMKTSQPCPRLSLHQKNSKQQPVSPALSLTRGQKASNFLQNLPASVQPHYKTTSTVYTTRK